MLLETSGDLVYDAGSILRSCATDVEHNHALKNSAAAKASACNVVTYGGILM